MALENTNAKATVGTSAGTLATVGPDTLFLQIHNADPSVGIHLSFDGTDATTSNTLVPAGEVFKLEGPVVVNMRGRAISAIAGSSNPNVYVLDLGSP